MNRTYITDKAKLVEQISRFSSFVQQTDGRQGFISFRDSNGFLGREEDYKSRIAEEARVALKFSSWNESWIGTGKIADCARNAIGKAGNLVNVNQQIDFRNRLDPDSSKFRPEAEKVLYEIYRGSFCGDDTRSEADAFEKAVEVFGAKYDVIAFLFFIKDDSRFLPISTGHFDKGFAALKINYITSYRCSWKNYQGFIGIIKEIRDVMEEVLPLQSTPRLIDAHSFVWVIQEDRFINWSPDAVRNARIEQETEKYIQNAVSGAGGRRSTVSNTFIRSAEVVKETRKRANGVCQYCNQAAPFTDKNGEPYLEVHHVIWLSRGGEDSTANTVALCPNCHAKMHILDKPEDVKKLQEIIKSSTKIQIFENNHAEGASP